MAGPPAVPQLFGRFIETSFGLLGRGGQYSRRLYFSLAQTLITHTVTIGEKNVGTGISKARGGTEPNQFPGRYSARISAGLSCLAERWTDCARMFAGSGGGTALCDDVTPWFYT